MKRRKQKPLATIRGPVNAVIYKAKFQPFESTKYLNVAALKKAKKVPIQIGSIEAAGMKVTVEAEVDKGLITHIRPAGCENCGPPKSKGKTSGAFKKVAREALERVRALGKPTVKLPIPISHLSREAVDRIHFGPVLITLTGMGASRLGHVHHCQLYRWRDVHVVPKFIGSIMHWTISLAFCAYAITLGQRR